MGYHFTGSHAVDVAEAYGYTGVTFFYLLSGFVLTWSQNRPRHGRFWWGRVARIWPLTLVLSAFAFTVVASQETVPGPTGHALNLLLLQAWWPRSAWYFGGNGVTWSLSCEMFFYLLFPFLVRPLRRLDRRGLAALAAAVIGLEVTAPAVAGALGMPGPVYFWLFFIFPPFRLLQFVLGMTLARAVALGLRLPSPRLGALLALAGLGAVAYLFTAYTVTTGSYVARPFADLAVIPPLALLLLCGASGDLSGTRSWLSSRPLVVLGESSFALYLVHKPLYLFTRQFGWWQNSGHLRGFLLLLAFVGFAILVAVAAHSLFERPLDRVLRRLPDRIRLGPAAPGLRPIGGVLEIQVGAAVVPAAGGGQRPSGPRTAGSKPAAAMGNRRFRHRPGSAAPGARRRAKALRHRLLRDPGSRRRSV